MEVLQIIVLILGVLIFTVSFFIPDKKADTKESRAKEERIFKELMEREMPKIRQQMESAAEESIEQAKEDTKRQMERLTNEKMMAINEYSDTVMTEIHKNHEEAVFLYDMLNNKHAQVKNTAAELNQVVKQSKQIQNGTKGTKKETKKKTESAPKPSFEPMESKELETVVLSEKTPEPVLETASAEKTEKADNAPAANVEIMFATEGNEENSNDRILELHKQGKSNMAIARELGLGIGEVKLVIDLFKGGM